MSKQKYPTTMTSASGKPTASRNIKQNGYSNFTLHAKRNRKRQEAEERQAAYAKLPLAEKMKYAGKKELAKLQKRLAAQTPAQIKPAPLTEAEKSQKAIDRAVNAANAVPKPKSKKAAKK
jgi:hypothetical protein